jgi:membrane protein DedA with SNARE-associated domain
MMVPLNVAHLLASYGYGAVVLFVTLESTGIPFPGETMLVVAAIAAGTTHQLSIGWVIVAAASGAILGDNLGFWIGREAGFRIVRSSGRFVRLDERKLKLGHYLFRHRMGAKWSSDGALCYRAAHVGSVSGGNESDAMAQVSPFQRGFAASPGQA